MNSKILIFVKSPIPGLVKTRLISSLGIEKSCEIYLKLIKNTIKKVSIIKKARIELWCYPSFKDYFIKKNLNLRYTTYEQHKGDLGEKMYNAIKETLGNSTNCIIIGCDTPSISSIDIEIALKKLKDLNDIVYIPCEDGGFGLIGLKKITRVLFERIDWGTSNVTRQLKKNIQKLNWRSYEFPIRWDVDNYKDYLRLKKEKIIL